MQTVDQYILATVKIKDYLKPKNARKTDIEPQRKEFSKVKYTINQKITAIKNGTREIKFQLVP